MSLIGGEIASGCEFAQAVLAGHRRRVGVALTAPAFLKLYPARTDDEVRAVARRVEQDSMVGGYAGACAVSMARRSLSANSAAAIPACPASRSPTRSAATIGACHTADIPHWSGTQDMYDALRPTRNWTPWERTLSARMRAALIALAGTGSPNTPGPPWKPWSPGNDTALWQGDSIEVRPIDVAGQICSPRANPPPPRSHHVCHDRATEAISPARASRVLSALADQNLLAQQRLVS